MSYSQCCNDVLIFLDSNLPTSPNGYVTGTIIKGLNDQYDDESVDQALLELYLDGLIDGQFVYKTHPQILELGLVREVTNKGKLYLQQLNV